MQWLWCWRSRFNSQAFAALLLILPTVPATKAQKGQSQSELQATIKVISKNSATPTFEVELWNIGDRDLILNLGMMLGNGRRQYADAIHLVLRDEQNKIETLDLIGPPYVAGRMDAFVAPLPRGARLVLPIHLSEYWIPAEKIFKIHLKPGRYFLSAEYKGESVKMVNLDMRGIQLLPYWQGSVTSAETSFKVPKR